LSQTVTSLEHSLGIPLFHRIGRKLVPTREGLRIQQAFSRAQGGFLAALTGLSREQNKVTGLLRVGAYLEFAKAQLTPILSGFLRKHPEAQVKLTFDTPSRLQSLLEKGSLDLCFSIYPSQETRTIASRPIFHEELVLVAPRGLLPASPGFQQILEAPVVEYYFNHQPLRRWLELHFRKRPRKLNVRAFASTAEMVLALAAEGVGVGVVPLFLPELKGNRAVSVIRPSSRRFLDHIWLLERKTPLSPAHLAFREEAVRRLAPESR
jgi:DNA-binding transcriptional LysR family regulator